MGAADPHLSRSDPGPSLAGLDRAREPGRSRSSTAISAFPLMARAGASMPSSSPTRSACTPISRSAGSACSRASCTAPPASSWTPACTPRAGAASNRSAISPRMSGSIRFRRPARSSATSSGRARRAATRSAITRSSGCARRRGARLGDRFDIKAFHDAVLLNGDMPLEVLGTRGRGLDAGRVTGCD